MVRIYQIIGYIRNGAFDVNKQRPTEFRQLGRSARHRPMPPGPRGLRSVLCWSLENISEDQLVLLEYQPRNGKVALQFINFHSKIWRQIDHISPQFAFGKELDEGQVAQS